MELLLSMSRIRPCHMYPCKIYHNDIHWVCEYAGTEDAVGVGDNPSAAMLAFDLMWFGNP